MRLGRGGLRARMGDGGQVGGGREMADGRGGAYDGLFLPHHVVLAEPLNRKEVPRVLLPGEEDRAVRPMADVLQHLEIPDRDLFLRGEGDPRLAGRAPPLPRPVRP